MDDELRWYLLRKKTVEGLILKAFAAFRRAGIEPILIKGWAAARNYPPDKPRFSGDIDLAVSRPDYDRALSILADPNTEAGGVDLHCELRHLDTVEWSALMARSELVTLEDSQVRVLAPEDHLRVLAVHWLTNGGEDRERLWDIFYAVQNRPEGFNWDACLDSVSENRRQWIIATIGLAHRYCGLEIDDLPFSENARQLPGWLVDCLEREWKNNVVLRPLHTALKDPKALIQQIRKRVPPNPIQATVECEGRFDDSSRIRYQIHDALLRIGPSLRRIVPTLFKNSSGT